MPPSPERIVRYATGAWQCGILAAAVRHGVFVHVQAGAADAATLAARAGISLRGAQALLDGLRGMGLLTRVEGVYRNAPDAAHYLVGGRPEYLGDFVQLGANDMAMWKDLGDAALHGAPLEAWTSFDPAEHPAWQEVVLGISPLALAAARASAEHLGVEDAGPMWVLDVGGGAGVFAAVWLNLNAEAHVRQIDWANVNRLAREYVGAFGVADRFETVDGDLREVDLGRHAYDHVVLCQISHFYSPAENRLLLERIHRALRPGGTLALVDFVLDDDRDGHPWALMFHANMLLTTAHGQSYCQRDYVEWLREAGFAQVAFAPLASMPHTLVYAQAGV